MGAHSFVIRNGSGQVVAVALNFDLFDEPVVEPKVRRLAYVFEFLEAIEAPVRDKHFEKRTNLLIHSFMMATAETSSPLENIQLIQKTEKETLELAIQKGFVGVFTTNTNELTRVTRLIHLRQSFVPKYQLIFPFRFSKFATTYWTILYCSSAK